MKKIDKYEESILESVAAQNTSEINKLENKKQTINQLLNNMSENISTTETLLTSTSTARERINYIKSNPSYVTLLQKQNEPKNSVVTNVTYWISSFCDWSSSLLDSLSTSAIYKPLISIK